MNRTPHLIIGLLLCLVSNALLAQVSVGSYSPKSTLDVAASNASAPAATDGILVPRVSQFPASNPGADQNAMLVFLNETNGINKRGLHYWDNSKTSWVPFGGEWVYSINELDEPITYAKQANENGIDVVFKDGGGLGMGTDDPQENLDIKIAGLTNGIQITSASPPNAPNIITYTTSGTYASPDFLDDGDDIGGLAGKVWTGSEPSNDAVTLDFLADGDHVSGGLATKYHFSVTAPNDTSEASSGVEMTIRASGNIGLGDTNPTAFLQIKAGTSAANTAPMKFTSGSNLSTPEAGALEYNGSHLYFTANTQRKILLKGLTNTATLDFPILVHGVTDELIVSVPGASVGSSCNCAPLGSIENNLKWSCYISAANIVKVRLSNLQTSPINPASKSWKVTVIE